LISPQQTTLQVSICRSVGDEVTAPNLRTAHTYGITAEYL